MIWIAIIVGGVPSIFYIFKKLLKGNMGADLLAAIAIITAVILGQYLAAVIVILMKPARSMVKSLKGTERWTNHTLPENLIKSQKLRA